MLKVAIADDHAVVRTGLQLFFQVDNAIQILHEASNGQELIDTINSNQIDLVIIDLNMPGKDSLDLINELKNKYPDLPIVIFTMSTDENMILRLFNLGIKAFINKEESPNELLKALKVAATGQTYLTQAQERLFANQFINKSKDEVLHENLTNREYQIMCLLAAGQSNSLIASKLSISKNTISNHRNNILKKLNVANIAELTKYALKYQLIN